MQTSKVSIITPIYKPSEHEFERTYYSVATQTSSNYEWILLIDGTADYLFDFVPQLQDVAHMDLTKIVTLWDNYGPSVARNTGFQVSDGDIITYVDVGDELDEYRIEHTIGYFKEFKDIDILLSPYTIIQEGLQPFVYDPRLIIANYFGSLEKALKQTNISIPLGMAHNRSSFIRVGGFQPGIVCGEDGILLRRMVEYGNAKVMMSQFISGIYYASEVGQSRTQRRFDMGGFAFDAGNLGGKHGQYLDEAWFSEFHSRREMDK
jgi:glycosyltransferase involved in cell wall biosynthesis